MNAAAAEHPPIVNSAVAEQIRATVEARIRELQPALSELEQLQGVLAVLDGNAPIEAALLHPQRRGVRPGRDGRAPQGANKQRILAVIAAHPGVAAPQIARLTGLKRPVVASTISRLKRTGELRACDQGVSLPDAPGSAAPALKLAAGSGRGER